MARPDTTDIVSKPSFLERNVRVFQSLLVGVAIRFEEFLELHPIFCGVTFSILYCGWALLISHHKQLWFDELVTYSVDHVPTWRDAWHALQIGVDANPPLFHFANRLFLAVLGDSNEVQRASSIFGFWAMSLCVYAIVRSDHSAAAAWVAALIPACSGAAYYATEARPYGMVLAFVSLAIICWMKSVDASNRKLMSYSWTIGLTMCLACAISSHYYAVFTVLPFIGAELTRGVKRSKLDWTILGALVASYLPLVIFYTTGLMAAAGQYTGGADRASMLLPVHFWELILGPVLGSIATAIGIALIWNWLGGKRLGTSMIPSNSILIAAWLCLLPLVVVLAARYVTHAYEHRYAISAVIGAAILIGFGFDVLRTAVPGAAGLAIFALILPITADAIAGRNAPRGRHIDYAWAQSTGAEPDLPIVYGTPLEFVQAWYNAPSQELQKRITCLVDVKDAWARTKSTTADLGVINLKPALLVPARNYHDFASLRRNFYLIHEPHTTTGWVTKKLVEDGANLKLLGIYGNDEVYIVTWGP